MSLADELLADLDAIEDEDIHINPEDEDGEFKEAMELDDIAAESSTKSVCTIARLRDNKEFQQTLKQMDAFLSSQRSRDAVQGPVEHDPEYKLIVSANNLTAEIENETSIINKYCRDNYSKRFPELDSLVPDALEYIQTVQALGNNLDPNKIDNLDFLPPATRMVVSVTASTTQGIKIEAEELENINEACQMNMDLMNAKLKIFQYIESRMSFIAPNVSVIVGASTAAKVMGVAGGLGNLSKMPSCNIMLLGSQKKMLTGFSMTSSQVLPHTGFIFYSDIVQVSTFLLLLNHLFLLSVGLSVCWSLCWSVGLSLSLLVCLSVCWSVSQSVCLSVFVAVRARERTCVRVCGCVCVCVCACERVRACRCVHMLYRKIGILTPFQPQIGIFALQSPHYNKFVRFCCNI